MRGLFLLVGLGGLIFGGWWVFASYSVSDVCDQ
jgi:hypothetical protein